MMNVSFFKVYLVYRDYIFETVLEIDNIFFDIIIIIPSTDVIQLTLTLKMTTAQVVETSVTVNKNSPIQDCVQPYDHTQPPYIIIIRYTSVIESEFPWTLGGKEGFYLKERTRLRR